MTSTPGNNEKEVEIVLILHHHKLTGVYIKVDNNKIIFCKGTSLL